MNWASQSLELGKRDLKTCLVEIKCSKEGRGRLDTALKEVIGIEVEIADIEPSIEAEHVEDAVKDFFDNASELKLKGSLTKRPYRGNRKAYVLLEEARALKLLKATHIKIGWVSWRGRQKMEVNRSYRCLGSGNMAANCQEPNLSKNCWMCGEAGHFAGSCTRKPQCYFRSAKEHKLGDDHIPGKIRCATFLETVPKRNTSRGRV